MADKRSGIVGTEPARGLSLSRPGGLTSSVMLSAIMLLAGMPVMAQPVRATATYPDSIQVRRDLALEQAARTRASTLAASLRPEARAKLDLAARAVLAALESGRGNSDPDPLVRREVRRIDRRSKFMSTLSNLMKRTSDTRKSVIQNLK